MYTDKRETVTQPLLNLPDLIEMPKSGLSVPNLESNLAQKVELYLLSLDQHNEKMSDIFNSL